MNFTHQTRVRDMALSNPGARQILEDAGLDYCCGGGKSLKEACLHADIPPEEVLDLLRENAKNATTEDKNWMTAPLCDLTKHIREKHHGYVRQAIPHTQALMDKVASKHGENHKELFKIGALFAEVGREMIVHMQKEEMILFPYIDSLERASEAHESIEPPFFQTVRNPIHMMMKEHDASGHSVAKIRFLTSDYTPPAGACTSFKALYEALKEFETDLHQHVHLENNILFPRAVDLEATAGRPSSR